jgi:hypothetical protein
MNTNLSDKLPAPPRLFKTLVAGFDTITNHIPLLLLPIGLDLLIWLSPRFRLKALIELAVGDLMDQSLLIAPDPETREVLTAAQELWILAGEHFNILIGLRSYPVGIPSLMSSIMPLESPLGTPVFIEINSFFNSVVLFIIFALLGLTLGTVFYNAVAQAALSSEINWRSVIKNWPWLSFQVFLLALSWLAIFIGVTIPASCIVSLAALGNIAFGQCAFLIYGGFLIWIIFPLLFSAHGIFVNRQKVWPSIKQGIHITRLTFPTTSLFFISVLLLTQILDLLWQIPPENSWLMLVGLAGHAFVTTGLLSASFIYYRDADRWIRSLQNIDSNEISNQTIT